MARKGVMLIEA